MNSTVFLNKDTLAKLADITRRQFKTLAAGSVLAVHLALAATAGAAFESGVYQTIPGATVEERGDRVPNSLHCYSGQPG